MKSESKMDLPPETIIDLPPPALEQRAQRSPHINELAQALNKAQGKLADAKVTGKVKTPRYSYEYADLTEIWRVARPALAANGLAVAQTFDQINDSTYLVTTLTHNSGQFLESRLPLMKVLDYHGLGSAVTYSRRISLAALLGIAPQGSDDDGLVVMELENEAGPIPASRKNYPKRKPKQVDVKHSDDDKQLTKPAAKPEQGRPRAPRIAAQAQTTTIEPANDLDDGATEIAKKVDGCVAYLRAFDAWDDKLQSVKAFARANIIKQGLEGMEKLVAENQKESNE